MKNLIDENYNITIQRGLINKDTKVIDFINKINEEYNELLEVYNHYNAIDELELADIILTCLNFATHYDIDIIKRLNEKININKLRIK